MDKVVCLLIRALRESEQATVYKSILDEAESIYGSHQHRNPISVASLKLNMSIQKIRTELNVRQPDFKWLAFFITWLIVFVGNYLYLPSPKGQHYLNELVELADIFVMDGRINMIISGTSAQREQLTALLDRLEQSGAIVYGIHVSRECIISCYVQNRSANHIHFIDGGYTQAAVVLKEKLKKAAGA